MKKHSAFTLIEVTIAMVITGILMVLAVLSYEIIYEQYYNYRKTNNSISEIYSVNSLLTREFFISEKINKIDSGIILTEQNGSLVIYSFEPSYILRKVKEVTDTFNLEILNITYNFQGKQQAQEKGLVDEIIINTKVFKQDDILDFKKEYGSEVLINAEIDSINGIN